MSLRFTLSPAFRFFISKGHLRFLMTLLYLLSLLVQKFRQNMSFTLWRVYYLLQRNDTTLVAAVALGSRGGRVCSLLFPQAMRLWPGPLAPSSLVRVAPGVGWYTNAGSKDTGNNTSGETEVSAH